MAGSYRKGIESIALNDEPECLDVEEMVGYASVMVIADAFGKTSEEVAAAVVRWRLRHPDVL